MEQLFRQIGDEVIEFTAEEYAQAKLDKLEADAAQKATDKAAADKSALLAKLGLSADELATLLG